MILSMLINSIDLIMIIILRLICLIIILIIISYNTYLDS